MIRGDFQASAWLDLNVCTRAFYRTFDNRRQIASYLGLAPTPFQSGGMDRDRRINRAGNSRARKTLVQLAWLWLRGATDVGWSGLRRAARFRRGHCISTAAFPGGPD